MPKVLITDNVAAEGIDLLRERVPVDIKRGLSPDELVAAIGDYDALVVRSETRVTEAVIAAGRNLKVVARAGIGVDNIDLDAATRAGVAVVNAPVGNTVAAAEHTMALMLALARNVPQAKPPGPTGLFLTHSYTVPGLTSKTRLMAATAMPTPYLSMACSLTCSW